ncbi:hypothetical protein pdam_00023799, partial [Pocillopora damicornis]
HYKQQKAELCLSSDLRSKQVLDKMSSQGITNTTKDQLLHEQRKQEVLPQLLPISLFIILTNIVVFILFCSKPELRKASNYLLFSLAICDFMNGSLNIPLFIVIFIPVNPIGLVLETSFNIFCLLTIFAALYTFIICAYVTIFRKVRDRNANQNNRQRFKTQKKRRNEYKCFTVFATMAIAFAIVGCRVGQRLITLNYADMEAAAHVILIVRYLTSVVNPLLYSFFKQDFWGALRRSVLKVFRNVKSTSRKR